MNLITELFYTIIKLSNATFSFSQKIHLCWVLIKLTFYKITKKYTHPAKVKVFGFIIEDYSFRLLDYLIKEIFVGNEYKFITKNEKPIIFDCGANIGMATIYFKWLYPNATIHAFEPQIKTFEYLQKNVQNNKLEDVFCYNLALSDYNGKIDFYENNESNLMASIMSERVVGNKISVECRKLSEFLTQPIDLLKIDVEGAECYIIDDLVKTNKLKKTEITQITMEYHHKISTQKSTMSGFLKPFEDNNYEYQIRADFSRLNIFQDMLISFF